MATNLESPEAAAGDVPWRSLATSLIGGVGSLLAWHATSVSFLFPLAVAVTVMLSCWAREPEPSEASARAIRAPLEEMPRLPAPRQAGLYARPRMAVAAGARREAATARRPRTRPPRPPSLGR